MISDEPIGIIELGNVKIKCIIFKLNNDNNFEILSASLTNSEGIHNGVVVNPIKASKVIRSCISKAEKQAEVSIKKINVILEQPELLCTKLSRDRKINGSKIQKEDIEFLLTDAKKQVTLNDSKQLIIHIFNHNYIVDGKTFLEEPINVYADYLSHEMTFITMPKNNIKNINQVFFDCDIEVGRYISCTFAVATYLLNINELKFGSTLIDIGFEKTSFGVFKNLALIHSATLPIGVNHIVKDFSKVCSLSPEESKSIINKFDFSFEKNNHLFDQNGHLKNSYFHDSNFRKISESLLLNILKARLNEIFGLIKKQIHFAGYDSPAGTNLYIVGGGSNLLNLDQYCSNFFGSDVKKIKKTIDTNSNYMLDENFDSCLGGINLIKDGWETEAIPENANQSNQKTSLLARIFGN